MLKNKKGELQALYGYIMWFIIIAMILGVGLLVVAKVRDQIATSIPSSTAATIDGGKNTTAYLAVNTTIKEVGGYADWFGIIVIVTVAALILGIVLRAFVFRTRPTA